VVKGGAVNTGTE